ncbi:MAG: GFA family protein [Sedimentitalea sp.]|nr:GFA family protein [Sedimentitalea sp.]
MTETGPRTGQCLCGAVKLILSGAGDAFGACHCEMCRRWTGSALLAFEVPAEGVRIEGAASVARIQSSDWAERAFCARCGSGLWYRLTAMPDGAYQIPLGLLDDPGGMRFTSEIFVDCKPGGFAYAGAETRETMTRAEVFAKYAPGGEVPE